MMKKALGIVAATGLAIVLVVSLAHAEKKDAPSGQMGMMGRGGMMGSGGMMGHSGKTGHGGMRGMMPGMMGGGTMGMPCPGMGMMGGQAADPKLHGEMMVLKGQMMKKMAEMMSNQGDRMIEKGRKQVREAGK